MNCCSCCCRRCCSCCCCCINCRCRRRCRLCRHHCFFVCVCVCRSAGGPVGEEGAHGGGAGARLNDDLGNVGRRWMPCDIACCRRDIACKSHRLRGIACCRRVPSDVVDQYACSLSMQKAALRRQLGACGQRPTSISKSSGIWHRKGCHKIVRPRGCPPPALNKAWVSDSCYVCVLRTRNQWIGDGSGPH